MLCMGIQAHFCSLFASRAIMKNLTVLVLEDEPIQRLVTVTALKSLLTGTILQAADGSEALEILHSSGPVDIVLCDLKMPGMDGLEFLRHASATGKVCSVVLCSELDPVLRQATVAMVQCLGMRFLGDLGKPFNLEIFTQMVNRYHALCVCASTPEGLSEYPSLEDVQSGLDGGEFEAYYQPKVCLLGNRLAGAEVLARWIHPEMGVLTAAHFLPVMEAHGLIDKLFWLLFAQGLSVHKQLSAHGLPINLAFNLHPSQLTCSRLTERIAKILTAMQVPFGCITFEITETHLITAPAKSLENLVRLRIMGCGLAMDDFGAGYSSLDRLSELPFSQIKLDRSFVGKIQTQSRSEAIISCAVALAKSLSISLVVEGIETVEQQDRLIKLGAVYAQGYLYARPLPAQHFVDYCGTHRAGALLREGRECGS